MNDLSLFLGEDLLRRKANGSKTSRLLNHVRAYMVKHFLPVDLYWVFQAWVDFNNNDAEAIAELRDFVGYFRNA